MLPLSKNLRKVYVTGPLAADTLVLLGNYYGVSPTLTTFLEGIAGKVSAATTVEYRQGALLDRPNVNPIDWYTGEAKNADVTIAVVGNSQLLEGEEGESIASPDKGDRSDIRLPPSQLAFLKRIRAAARQLVVVICGGGPIADPEVHDLADAIVFAWYPGQEGGAALADVLFGDVSPSGRLPVTFPKSIDQLPPYADYRMTGRTYRYMKSEPLYPFGFGLGYTRFSYSMVEAPGEVRRDRPATLRVRVTNEGTRAGDEILQLYVSGPGAGERRPFAALRAMRRVALAPGESRVVELPIAAAMFTRFDEGGREVLDEGEHAILVGGASPGARSVALGAPEPVRAVLRVR